MGDAALAFKSDDGRRVDPAPVASSGAAQAVFAALAPVLLAILEAANTNAASDIRGRCAHATGPNRLITQCAPGPVRLVASSN